MTHSETQKILATISTVVPSAKITPERIDGYHAFLRDLPYQSVAIAVTDLLKSATFMPSVGEIRNEVVRLVALQEGIPDTDDAYAIASSLHDDPGIEAPDLVRRAKNITGGRLEWDEAGKWTYKAFSKHYERLIECWRDSLVRGEREMPPLLSARRQAPPLPVGDR